MRCNSNQKNLNRWEFIPLSQSKASPLPVLAFSCHNIMLLLTTWLTAVVFASDYASAAELPNEWQFRLAGGPTGLSGRVEMRPNASAPWGTICKDRFKENNLGPIAACNSAGLVGVTQAAYSSAYGAGTGPIYLTNVACASNNQFIQNCSRSPLLETGSCVHYEDVGVDCSPPIHLWQFKMVNGTAPSNGLVMMQPMPSLPWGLVSNFNFLYNGWMVNRQVMCRVLGFGNRTWVVPTDLPTSNASAFFGPDPAWPRYLYLSSCASASITSIGMCSYQNIGSTAFSELDSLVLDCDPRPRAQLPPTTEVKLLQINTWKNGTGIVHLRPSADVAWGMLAASDGTDQFQTGTMPTSPATQQQQRLLNAICHDAGFPPDDGVDAVFAMFGPWAPVWGSFGYNIIYFQNFMCPVSSSGSTNANATTTVRNCTAGPAVWDGYTRFSSFYTGVDCYPKRGPQLPLLSGWQFRLNTGGSATTMTTTAAAPGINGTSPNVSAVSKIGTIELRPNSASEWLGICPDRIFASSSAAWNDLCAKVGHPTTSARRLMTNPNPPSGRSSYYLAQGASCPLQPDPNLWQMRANNTIDNCTYLSVGSFRCNPSEDLVLDCGFPSIRDMRVRLTNGTSPSNGVVEVLPGPGYEWGTLSDPWSANMDYSWIVATAFAVCRSVGYAHNVTNPVLTTRFRPFSNASAPVWWSNIMCNSGDMYLNNCTHSSTPAFGFTGSSQNHALDMGVDCFPPTFHPITTLVDGGAPWKGRVMYQYAAAIPSGTVCNDYFKYNHFAWNAVCRSAGFLNVTRAAYQSFGPGTGDIVLDDVQCTQSNTFFDTCYHRPYGQHNCHHGEDAGVDCYPPPEQYDQWQFRLVDGTSSSNGRVEMRASSGVSWGSICAGPYFNHSAAAWLAACRSVGFTNVKSATWWYPPRGPTDTIYLDNVSCAATNTFLTNCSMFPLGSFTCSPWDVAGVDCDPPPEEPEKWEFRLMDGRNPTSGRLEMRPDDKALWGAVCRTNFDVKAAARTVCRTMGIDATRPITRGVGIPPRKKGQPVLRLYLDHAECNDTTNTLHDCAWAPLYSYDCDPTRDVLYIDCNPTATVDLPPTATPSHTLLVGAGSSQTPTHPNPTATFSGGHHHNNNNNSNQNNGNGGLSQTHSDSALSPSMPLSASAGSRSPSMAQPSLAPTPPTPSQTTTPTLCVVPSHTIDTVPTAPPSTATTNNNYMHFLRPVDTTAPTTILHSSNNNYNRNSTTTGSVRDFGLVAIPSAFPLRDYSTIGNAGVPTTTTAIITSTFSNNYTLRPYAAIAVPAWFVAPTALDTPLAVPSATFSLSVLMPPPSSPPPPSSSSSPSPLPLPVVRWTIFNETATAAFLLSSSSAITTSASTAYGTSTSPHRVAVLFVVVQAADFANCPLPRPPPHIAVLRVVVHIAEDITNSNNTSTNTTNTTTVIEDTLPTKVVVAPPPLLVGAAAAPALTRPLHTCRHGDSSTTTTSTSTSTTITGSMAMFRMLSPFAVGPSFVHVIAGSAAITAVVLVLQGLTTLVLHRRMRRHFYSSNNNHENSGRYSPLFSSLVWSGGAARAPGITIAFAEPLWFGTAFAGAALVVGVGGRHVSGDGSSSSNINVPAILSGLCAAICAIILPFLTAWFAWRFLSRRVVRTTGVNAHPIPAQVAPHLIPYTRVKPEVLVKSLAPVISFRSAHWCLPALSGLSPALTAIIVLALGAVCGPAVYVALCIVHVLLALLYAYLQPRRTTLLNGFAVLQCAVIALWSLVAAIAVADQQQHNNNNSSDNNSNNNNSALVGVLYVCTVLQTLVVGVRIALVPLAFFSDRILPYSGVVRAAAGAETGLAAGEVEGGGNKKNNTNNENPAELLSASASWRCSKARVDCCDVHVAGAVVSAVVDEMKNNNPNHHNNINEGLLWQQEEEGDGSSSGHGQCSLLLLPPPVVEAEEAEEQQRHHQNNNDDNNIVNNTTRTNNNGSGGGGEVSDEMEKRLAFWQPRRAPFEARPPAGPAAAADDEDLLRLHWPSSGNCSGRAAAAATTVTTNPRDVDNNKRNTDDQKKTMNHENINKNRNKFINVNTDGAPPAAPATAAAATAPQTASSRWGRALQGLAEEIITI